MAKLTAHQKYITRAHFLYVDAGMPSEPSVKEAECCSVEVTSVTHSNETITPPSHKSSSKARCIAGMKPLFLLRLTRRTMISLTSQMRLRSGCRDASALVSMRLLRSRQSLCVPSLAPYSLPPGRDEPLGSPAGLRKYVGGLTYGSPYKGDKRIQSFHRLGALQYTRLVMLAARDRTMIMPRTVIFAVAHLGFVAWPIPFGFEPCAAPVGSLMSVLVSRLRCQAVGGRDGGNGLENQSVGPIRNIAIVSSRKWSTATGKGEGTQESTRSRLAVQEKKNM